jgi:hypothetical protein
MRFARTLTVAFAAATLVACASPIPPGDVPMPAAATPYGTWSYSMEGPQMAEPLAGTFTIARAPGESRITAVQVGMIDRPVMDETLEIAADGFIWRGEVDGNAFVIRGRVEGDRIVGSNEVPQLGTLTVNAERVRPAP